MNKTKRVVFTSVAVTIATVGMLNIADSIYAGTPVNADTSGLTMSATIEPSSTVTIGANAVNLDIVPSANGTFKASTPVTVSAYTNSNYDCTITMQTTSTSLTSGSNSIATLDNTSTEANFTNDKWGYSIDATNYNGVALSNTIGTFTTTTPSAASVTFATKLTQATKPGTYSGEVNFATTCTPPPVSDISELTYMQDFANLTSSEKSDVLGSMTTGTQYQLKDSRDQKEYYISKLADGNVWMTQSLDHDIVTTANFYTPSNTDISANWTASTATYATGTTTWATGTTGNTTPQSYDPGDLCWNGVLDYNWETTLSNGTVACGDDKHMSIGNYYNWTAAIAMNNSSSYTTQNTDVNQSICPAGWRLPIGGTTNTGSKSFRYLWNQYSSSFSGDTMMNSPLYLSYAGYWRGSSYYVGSYGNYYSSVAYSSNNAYQFNFDIEDGVNPQNSMF